MITKAGSPLRPLRLPTDGLSLGRTQKATAAAHADGREILDRLLVDRVRSIQVLSGAQGAQGAQGVEGFEGVEEA